jgi:hypothetical protein
MIKPTIGRVVWFYPDGTASRDAGEQPNSAMVAFVHNDRLINIGYLDHNGLPRHATSQRLLQEGDDEPSSPTAPFCCWMPFQVGQAKKHDAEATQQTASQYKGG